jgi:hypothetical protein
MPTWDEVYAAEGERLGRKLNPDERLQLIHRLLEKAGLDPRRVAELAAKDPKATTREVRRRRHLVRLIQGHIRDARAWALESQKHTDRLAVWLATVAGTAMYASTIIAEKLTGAPVPIRLYFVANAPLGVAIFAAGVVKYATAKMMHWDALHSHAKLHRYALLEYEIKPDTDPLWLVHQELALLEDRADETSQDPKTTLGYLKRKAELWRRTTQVVDELGWWALFLGLVWLPIAFLALGRY